MEDDPVGLKDLQMTGHKARLAEFVPRDLPLAAPGQKVATPADFPGGNVVVAGDLDPLRDGCRVGG